MHNVAEEVTNLVFHNWHQLSIQGHILSELSCQFARSLIHVTPKFCCKNMLITIAMMNALSKI